MAYPAEQALDYLRHALTTDRLAHAYLVTGPEGSGKRRLASAFAGMILDRPTADWPPPNHPDVHVLEPELKSRRIGIDRVRELEHSLQLRPNSAPRKIAIVVDADRLGTQASNAFLKTLEEPPRDSQLLLLTAHPEMLLDTVVSRCIRIPLHGATRVTLDGYQSDLLAALAEFTRAATFDLRSILLLSGRLQSILQERKDALRREADEALRADVSAAGDSAERDWVETREDHYGAMAEARYQFERARMIELLPAWWADALKQALDPSPHLDLPSHGEDTARLAASIPATTLLRVLAHLETLRDHLSRTNVREPLAIEVALLNLCEEIAPPADGETTPQRASRRP